MFKVDPNDNWDLGRVAHTFVYFYDQNKEALDELVKAKFDQESCRKFIKNLSVEHPDNPLLHIKVWDREDREIAAKEFNGFKQIVRDNKEKIKELLGNEWTDFWNGLYCVHHLFVYFVK